MMKRIFCCLLVAGLLFSLAIVAGAETPGDELPPEESSQTVTLVPCEEELPDGYVVDEDFYIELSLTADGGWVGNYTWEEILKEAADDGGDYIYFLVEDEIPEGYVALYSVVSSDLAGGGDIVIIKNVKQGEPPAYELPHTGGAGTTLYTVAGSTILLIASASAVLLHRRRKKNEA